MEIEWEDILQDDSGKGIFEMELEDVEETIDDDDQEGEQVCLFSWVKNKVLAGAVNINFSGKKWILRRIRLGSCFYNF